MEKKIKSVVTLKDMGFPDKNFVSAGTKGEKSKMSDIHWSFKYKEKHGYENYPILLMETNPDYFDIKYEEPEIESVEMTINGRWDQNDTTWEFYLMGTSIPISLSEENILNNPNFFKVKYKQ